MIYLLYDQAEFFFRINQHLKSINCLNKAIQLDSDFVEAYFLKGKCLERLSKNCLAIQCFDKAIQKNHVGAHNSKGFLKINAQITSNLFQIAICLNENPVSFKDFLNKGNLLNLYFI